MTITRKYSICSFKKIILPIENSYGTDWVGTLKSVIGFDG
jgi:hypothetical protein